MVRSSLAIHPNPVNDRLWMDSTVSGTVQLVVHDMTGREVMRQDDHNPRSIDVSDLTSGCYTLTIMRTEGTSSARFIKP
jgi:Secretion system C-terminal sorting domain